MLYQAVFVPPGQEPYDRSILELPEIAKYIANWGRKHDFGLIARVDDVPAGAVWIRLFDASEKGFGFIDEQTPELSIALEAAYRNKGLGKMMMEKFFRRAFEQGYRNVSLSVDRINPAFRQIYFDIIEYCIVYQNILALVAARYIQIKPGSHIQNGASLHAYITQSAEFCP